MEIKTRWKYKAKYNDGYIRTGINTKPYKDRPQDIIRLKIKTKNGEGDCDIHFTPGEASDICSGLSIVLSDVLEDKNVYK